MQTQILLLILVCSYEQKGVCHANPYENVSHLTISNFHTLSYI